MDIAERHSTWLIKLVKIFTPVIKNAMTNYVIARKHLVSLSVYQQYQIVKNLQFSLWDEPFVGRCPICLAAVLLLAFPLDKPLLICLSLMTCPV